MKVGDLVREMYYSTDRDLTLRPREIGMIVSAANDALGMHLKRTRYWEIMWADGLQVMLDKDLEVINESR